MKAKIHRDDDGRVYGVKILCPACLYMSGEPMEHILPVRVLPAGETEFSPHIGNRDRWDFNGDFEKPVFTPSLNTWWGGGNTQIPLHRCHSYIGCNGAAPGQIKYLDDCTHALKGQTVDLPDFKADHDGD